MGNRLVLLPMLAGELHVLRGQCLTCAEGRCYTSLTGVDMAVMGKSAAAGLAKKPCIMGGSLSSLQKKQKAIKLVSS